MSLSPRTPAINGLLRESLKIGFAVSTPVMFAVMLVSYLYPERLAGHGFSQQLLLLAAGVGCIAVIPGMVNGYWIGKQRRDLMLALAVISAVLPLAAALAVPQHHILAALAIATALPALVIVFIAGAKPLGQIPPGEHRHDLSVLRHYVPAGLAIGLLSPASMLAARSIVSSAMSWHDAGLLQALLRVSDWIASLAAGVLSVYFLPRLSAACGTLQFNAELRRAAVITLIPAAAALAAILVLQRPVFTLLYDESVAPSGTTVALFLAGSMVRIAAWIPLFALYALRRTVAITVGEVLSLPLWALLIGVFSEGLTLERASAMWLLSYLAYGLFNLWAVRRKRASD